MFAGPNGSGKSTIIRSIRQTLVNGNPIDFGTYVNADDISVSLAADKFTFADYELLDVSLQQLTDYGRVSGLFRDAFSYEVFLNSVNIKDVTLYLRLPKWQEQVAQLISNFLVTRLIESGKKCSVETVFSHVSKLHFMQQAAANGYKVYFYFVATEDAEINVERVRTRVSFGGHSVPEDRIKDRYTKSLELMYDAAQLAYQGFFFDNSGTPGTHRLVAHFKKLKGKKHWDPIDTNNLPDWFIRHYVNKQ